MIASYFQSMAEEIADGGIMRSLRSPSLAAEEWSAEEVSSDRSARDLDERSERGIGMRPVRPSTRSPHPSGFRDDQVASRRPPVGRRIFGPVTRFFVIVLIGVGATLGWQSYGDEARQMLLVRAPTLGWLLSISKTESPPVIANSSDLTQQLAPFATNLDVVRRNLELLAARQEQMSQNLAGLQAVEQDVREKLSFPAQPSPAPQAAAIPQRKPLQPRAQSSAVSSEQRLPAPAGPALPSR
jgi:hypothetical protein